MYLLLNPGKGNEKQDYMREAIEKIIVPCALARREKIIARDEGDTGILADPTKQKRIIFTFDGEHAHLQANLDLLVDNVPPAWEGQGIELLKWAASASKYQQPSDVATCYMTLKKLAQSEMGLTQAHYTDRIKRKLETHLELASARTYTEFLSRLPDLLSKSFTSPSIKNGWSRAGVWPINKEIIMQRCTTWKHLKNEQAEAILGAIPKLVDDTMQTGEVSDAAMHEAVGGALDFEEWMQTQHHSYKSPTTPLAELTLNRRRVVWVNHKGVTEARKAAVEKRRQEEAQRKAEAEEKQKERETKRAEKLEKKRKRDEAAAEKEKKKMEKVEKKARKAAPPPPPPPPPPPVPLRSGRQPHKPPRFKE